MSKVRVSAFAVSLDGYAAGPGQSLDNPLKIRLAQVVPSQETPNPGDSMTPVAEGVVLSP
jgi:hypothetical protein